MTGNVKAFLQSATISAFLIALSASAASGQTPAPAPSISGVQATFLAGAFTQAVHDREVWITTSNGSRLKARVTSMIPTGLTVTATDGQAQTIRFEDITRMERVTHRIRNHMTAGLIIGSGLGLLGAAFCDGDSGCFGAIFGFYAGAGVGIGALNGYIRNRVNRDDDIIYDAGIRSTTTMALAPILSRTRKGAAFTMTWR